MLTQPTAWLMVACAIGLVGFTSASSVAAETALSVASKAKFETSSLQRMRLPLLRDDVQLFFLDHPAIQECLELTVTTQLRLRRAESSVTPETVPALELLYETANGLQYVASATPQTPVTVLRLVVSDTAPKNISLRLRSMSAYDLISAETALHAASHSCQMELTTTTARRSHTATGFENSAETP